MHLPDYREARTRDKRDYKKISFEFDKNIKNKYKGKTFFIKTYGCQMNEHDSENISALLTSLGFSISDIGTDKLKSSLNIDIEEYSKKLNIDPIISKIHPPIPSNINNITTIKTINKTKTISILLFIILHNKYRNSLNKI